MPRESESLPERVGYKSVIDMGREATVPFPHNLCDYPTKILPQVMGEFVERLSAAGEVVLDPFAGGARSPWSAPCATDAPLTLTSTPMRWRSPRRNSPRCARGLCSNRRWWRRNCVYAPTHAHCRYALAALTPS